MIRPDIVHVIDFLSQCNAKLTKGYLAPSKEILRYLKYTKCMRLLQTGTADTDIHIYRDTDLVDNLADQKSISDIAISAFISLIYWNRKKQLVVVQSTADTEFVALATTMLEANLIIRVMNKIAIEAEILRLENDN